MLLPSVFERDLFDDFDSFFNDPWFDRSYNRKPAKKAGEQHRTKNVMNTDIKETKTDYEVSIDLPGFKKEEVEIELKEGYLIVSATKDKELEESDKDAGKYIRRERCTSACKRTFIVSKDITKEDVQASLKDGVLKLTIPKKEPKQEVEQKNYIAIE